MFPQQALQTLHPQQTLQPVHRPSLETGPVRQKEAYSPQALQKEAWIYHSPQTLQLQKEAWIHHSLQTLQKEARPHSPQALQKEARILCSPQKEPRIHYSVQALQKEAHDTLFRPGTAEGSLDASSPSSAAGSPVPGTSPAGSAPGLCRTSLSFASHDRNMYANKQIAARQQAWYCLCFLIRWPVSSPGFSGRNQIFLPAFLRGELLYASTSFKL